MPGQILLYLYYFSYTLFSLIHPNLPLEIVSTIALMHVCQGLSFHLPLVLILFFKLFLEPAVTGWPPEKADGDENSLGRELPGLTSEGEERKGKEMGLNRGRS
jgi:hypothetical protein